MGLPLSVHGPGVLHVSIPLLSTLPGAGSQGLKTAMQGKTLTVDGCNTQIPSELTHHRSLLPHSRPLLPMLPPLGPSHVDPAVSQVVYKPVEGLTGLPKGSEHQALHPLVGEQLCLHRANQANSCPDILLVCLPGLAYILLVKLVISNVLISICYALKSILNMCQCCNNIYQFF